MPASFLPTLSVINGIAAVGFYQEAFGAEVMFMIGDAENGIVAGLSIQGVEFIVADEAPDLSNYSPQTLGGTTIRIGLIVDDPDAVAAQAIAAGATENYPVADQDYGYRLGMITDPFGHRWEIARKL